METITKIIKEPAQKKPHGFLGLLISSLVEYMAQLPVEVRLRIFGRVFMALGVTFAIVFWPFLYDWFISATLWSRGFIIILPVVFLAIHFREDVCGAFRMVWMDLVTAYSRMRGFEVHVIHDVLALPASTAGEDLSLAGHLAADRQCKIECLENNLGIPYQRSRRILANLVTVKAMWIDVNHGNRRVLSDGVTRGELKILLDDLKHPDDILTRAKDLPLSPAPAIGGSAAHYKVSELNGS